MKTGLLNPTPLTPDAMGHAPIVDLVDMAPGHAESAALLAKARAFAEPLLLTERFETGEDALAHADREGLALIILDGVPGTAMPPWRPLLTEPEALWIADYLKGETP